MAPDSLLSPGDPAPVVELRPDGASPFLLIADHAGQAVPAKLGNLGLPPSELDRHIGWDIGIAGTTGRLSARLDAHAIAQAYSRLVIDCNRPLESPTLIVASSDGTAGLATESSCSTRPSVSTAREPERAMRRMCESPEAG